VEFRDLKALPAIGALICLSGIKFSPICVAAALAATFGGWVNRHAGSEISGVLAPIICQGAATLTGKPLANMLGLWRADRDAACPRPLQWTVIRHT